jgi:hypothetical protein
MEPFRFARDDGLVIHGPLRPYPRIRTIEEWRTHGKPLGGDIHWQDSYSAKEVAKVWLRDGRPAAPAEFTSLFASHRLTRALLVATAVPELVTPLQVTRGGGRHHDLVLFGETQDRRIVACVEAKTDEPLDDPLWVRVARVWEREIRQGKATAQVERLQRLCEAVFGRPFLSTDAQGVVRADAALAALPYQLFSGVVGTVLEADRRRADLAVFVVHAFACPNFSQQAVAENEEGIRSFFGPLLPSEATLEPGALVGPLLLPAGEPIPRLRVLVGTVTTAIPSYPEHRRALPKASTLDRLRDSYAAALQSPVLIEAVQTRAEIRARKISSGSDQLN